VQAHRVICPYGIQQRNTILTKPTIRRYVNRPTVSVVTDNSLFFSSLLLVRRHSNHKENSLCFSSLLSVCRHSNHKDNSLRFSSLLSVRRHSNHKDNSLRFSSLQSVCRHSNHTDNSLCFSSLLSVCRHSNHKRNYSDSKGNARQNTSNNYHKRKQVCKRQ
jgi:hypothetical protein